MERVEKIECVILAKAVFGLLTRLTQLDWNEILPKIYDLNQLKCTINAQNKTR